MMQNVNLIQPGDSAGCAHYRMFFPYWSVRTVLRQAAFIETTKFIGDPNFYKGITHVMMQRQVSDAQHQVFTKFMSPLSKQLGFWLTYNIDDVIGPNHIPKYNIGHKAYQGPNIFNNIKSMMNHADFLIVTTPELKYYYHEFFDVKFERIVDIPNYLPRWWVGEAYDEDRRMALFNENKQKPRIGFTSSTTHFDVNNQNGGKDDFTHIIDFIESTRHKYQWVFIGTFPKQLEQYIRDKEIELYPGSDILNFLRELHDKKLNAIVAPLEDNIFNRCKSNIKLVESWALGIPVIAQNLPLYSKYTDNVFNDSNDLQNKLDNLFKNEETYREEIRRNRHTVDYGDKNAPNGWWLEKNLTPWAKFFTLPQKTLNINLDDIAKHISVNQTPAEETTPLIIEK
jgi:glycosyltransferase involved in cell wall biosynthesis